MDAIIEKVSSYNLLNNLLPGAAFMLIGQVLGICPALEDDIVTRLVVYYFAGLLIGRIASLLYLPLFKVIARRSHHNYAAFIKASQTDKKLNELVEANNVYRSFAVAFFLLLGGFSIVTVTSFRISIDRPIFIVLLLAGCTALFVIANLKQARFISARVNAQESNDVTR